MGTRPKVSWSLSARLDVDVTAPTELRHRLWRELPLYGTREETILVANELATNAVLHGEAPVEVQVVVEPDVVRVEVHDEDPQMRMPTDDSRGLMLIDRVARAWGVSSEPGDGKVVWAEIPLRPSDQA